MLKGTVCQNKRTQALIDGYQAQFKIQPHRVDQILRELYIPDHLSNYHYKVVNKYTDEVVECDDGAQALEVMHDMARDNVNAPHKRFIWAIAPPVILYQEGVEVAFSAYNSEIDDIITIFPLYESFQSYAKYDYAGR